MTIEIVLAAGFAAVALVGAAVLREVRALRDAAAEQAVAERRDRAFAVGRLESVLEELSGLVLEGRGRRLGDRPTVKMGPVGLPEDEPEEEATKVAPRPAGSGLRLRAQLSAEASPPAALPDALLVERRTLLPPPSAKAR